MRALPLVLSFCALAALSACEPTVDEGKFSCESDRDCAEGWSCIFGRCYSSPSKFDGGASFDGSPQADALPPGADAASQDALPDGGEPLDALPEDTGEVDS